MPRPRVHLLVCTNERPADAPRPCCAARGGLEVYRMLKDHVRELGLRDEVLVTRTGCLRHCSRGVTVCVWPGNHWHAFVEPGDAAALIEAALRGEPLDARPMPDGPWE